MVSLNTSNTVCPTSLFLPATDLDYRDIFPLLSPSAIQRLRIVYLYALQQKIEGNRPHQPDASSCAHCQVEKVGTSSKPQPED